MIAHATLKNCVYSLTLQTIDLDFGLVVGETVAEVSDEKLHEHLEHGDEYPLSAFSIGEKSGAIGVYDWHRRMERRGMKTIGDMANGVVTRVVLKDLPGDPPKMDNCPSCAHVTGPSPRFNMAGSKLWIKQHLGPTTPAPPRAPA